MSHRSESSAAGFLAVASSATAWVGLGAEDVKWIASIIVGIAGIAASIWIHLSSRAEARRRSDVLEALEQKLVVRAVCEAAPPANPPAP